MKICCKHLLSLLLATVLLHCPIYAIEPAYTPETIEEIAHAVAAECPHASFGVQIALAAVILHRMDDLHFGNTAAQVIWANDFLTCTRTGRIALPTDETILAQTRAAVRYAIEGMDPTGGALWYGKAVKTVWYADDGYVFGGR